MTLAPPRLAPISPDPNPAATARNPSAGHPDCARPGWRRPTSRHPDIPSPVPAVISGNPHPPCVQCRSRTLHNDRGRRPHTNYYLRACRADAQRDPAYRDQQAFPDGHQNLRHCPRARTAYTKSVLRDEGLSSTDGRDQRKAARWHILRSARNSYGRYSFFACCYRRVRQERR